MTDGTQTLNFIEAVRSGINLDLKSGSKLLLKGPIQSMDGVCILTDPLQIQVVGGYVKAMSIQNSPVNALARLLNK